MQIGELINELRDWADVEGAGSLSNILNEAADKLEECEERIAIVEDSLVASEQFDAELREIGVREA